MNAEDKEDSLTLGILEAIENNEDVTQRHLANNLGVALGLANSYLKRCVKKGFIKIHQAPANRYLYYLTPVGFSEKARLTAQYFSTSFEFYRRAGDSLKDVYTECKKNGWKNLLLAGSSELTEIAILRSQEQHIDIVGIYHSDNKLKTFFGYPVINKLSEAAAFDALIEQLHKEVKDRDTILIPTILGINSK
jgi:DNA-binding MarR family transcriptional regulator